MPDTLHKLKKKLRNFAEKRDWEQFHSPKNLAMALIVEAAELVEHFQWMSQEESMQLSQKKQTAVSEELADILIYLVRLADRLDINLAQAVDRKMQINAEKYPEEQSRGSADKYFHYQEKK
jgi:NTP pyrophosphatase (non-canonical NTP hydrolase)